MEKIKITIQAIISADIQKTWEFYTNPEHIINWNFASDDWQCPTASNDLRIGGKYLTRMEAKDGSFGFDFEAIYDQISIRESFIYTMPDGRQVNVNFKDRGNQTEIIVTFDAETVNSVEMQKNGWQAILNNFKTYTETH
ncbi:MAG: SRPBCC family protein [Deltaproteobacteria bacterium]